MLENPSSYFRIQPLSSTLVTRRVVLGFPEQLAKFAWLLNDFDICQDRQDIGEFFSSQLVEYFASKPERRNWSTAWELFEEQFDELEASGRGEFMLELLEEILLQTQRFLPTFNDGPHSLVIDDVQPLGYSTVILTIGVSI